MRDVRALRGQLQTVNTCTRLGSAFLTVRSAAAWRGRSKLHVAALQQPVQLAELSQAIPCLSRGVHGVLFAVVHKRRPRLLDILGKNCLGKTRHLLRLGQRGSEAVGKARSSTDSWGTWARCNAYILLVERVVTHGRVTSCTGG